MDLNTVICRINFFQKEKSTILHRYKSLSLFNFIERRISRLINVSEIVYHNFV